MTVDSTNTRNTYTATGSLSVYPYTFRLLQATDLVVQVEATSGAISTLALNTDYTVSGVGIYTGGNVTLLAGNLPAGYILTLFRSPALLQPDLYQDQSEYDAASVMTSLDRTEMQVQAQADAISRAMILPGTETAPNYVFPAAALRKGLFPGFSPVDGSPGVFSPGSSTPISAAMIPVVTASNLGAGRIAFGDILGEVNTIAALKALSSTDLAGGQFVRGYYTAGDGGGGSYFWNGTDVRTDNGGSIIQPNVGGTGRWNLVTLGFVNVKQFGARGDGVTDDTAAIVAASSSIVGPVLIPPGYTWKYGGVISFTQEETLFDLQGSGVAPHTSQVINRNVSSIGTAGQQYGGLIVYDTVNAGANHNEYGLFGVVNSFTTNTALQHVGIYGQCNQLSAGGTASPCWAMVAQVGNIINGGASAASDAVLTGIEVDVDNKFPFSATVRKIGVECIAYGGGENNEAFSLAAANDTSANGTYNSGNWRLGLWVRPNSLNATQGVAVKIDSAMGTGVQILGVAGNYGLHLASGGGPTGLYVDAAWSTPITITADKSIKMNDSAGTQGISYVSARTAVELNAAAAGVSNHATQASATAGGGAALPGSVTGYLKFYVNGSEKRIPYYNP